MAARRHDGVASQRGESHSRSGLGFCAKSAGCSRVPPASPASFQQTETCSFSRLTGPRRWEVAPPPLRLGLGLMDLVTIRQLITSSLMVTRSAPYEPATSLSHYGLFSQKVTRFQGAFNWLWSNEFS